MTAHGSMHDRDRTALQGTLRRLGITYEQIAARAGVSPATVFNALDRRRHLTVTHVRLQGVRLAVLELVGAVEPRWLQPGVNLFNEYDEALRRELARRNETRRHGHEARAAAVH